MWDTNQFDYTKVKNVPNVEITGSKDKGGESSLFLFFGESSFINNLIL
jgi:hypothetical protein